MQQSEEKRGGEEIGPPYLAKAFVAKQTWKAQTEQKARGIAGPADCWRAAAGKLEVALYMRELRVSVVEGTVILAWIWGLE